MGIGKRGHFFLKAFKVMLAAGHRDKFLETDNVRILLVDIADNFTPGCSILIPLVVIKQAYIVSKETYLFFYNSRFLSFELKLKVFPENIPAYGNGDNGYQNIPFPENKPEQYKQHIDNKDERVTQPDKCKYPGGGRTDVNR
jgi:hypothetical protein